MSTFEQAVLYKNIHLAHVMESSRLLFDKPLSIGQVSFAAKKKVESDVLMIGDAAVGLAEFRIAAIAAVGLTPNAIACKSLCSIVLAAADDLLGISRVQSQTCELDGG